MLEIFWLFVILSSLQPVIRQRLLEAQRLRALRGFEERRKSRVISLIHRQETLSFLGFPLTRYIDIEDSERLLRAIQLTGPAVPIDLILHTPGGLVLAAEQIARALRRHPAKVTVFVPHYAMSGGTLIALAADEVIMADNAVLGPVDPQLGQSPAASIIKVLEQKPIAEVDDQTIILADIAQKALRQVSATVRELMSDRMGTRKAANVGGDPRDRDLDPRLSDHGRSSPCAGSAGVDGDAGHHPGAHAAVPADFAAPSIGRVHPDAVSVSGHRAGISPQGSA